MGVSGDVKRDDWQWGLGLHTELSMSSLWAEHALMYTPVDNLVFMEELQPQHHTGRIEAAETYNITQAWLHRSQDP